MTASTTERLAAFLLVVMTGTLWNSIPATAATTANFGPEPFLHHPPAFSRLSQQQQQSHVSTRISSLSANSDLLLLRGGETSVSDDDDETKTSSGLVVSKLRNLIRNFLKLSDDKAPVLSGFFRACFRTIESLTGMDLLSEEVKEKKKKSKSKSKSKKKSTAADKDSSSDSDSKSKSKKRKKKKNKPSAATKKHLAASIKSNNPNYRIQKELKSFLKEPPDNLSVQVGSNIRLWIITMVGAKDTIYEGEVFKLRVEFPKDYPTVPPSCFFLKSHMPVHEHVYTNGDICLSLLGKGWRPNMSAQSVAISILSILSSAQKKCLPMDNANHAGNKPGQYQKDWVYHDDNC